MSLKSNEPTPTEPTLAPTLELHAPTTTLPPKENPSPQGPADIRQDSNDTTIQLRIKGKSKLNELSKRFSNPSTPGNIPTPSIKNDFFRRLDIPSRIEIDSGLPFTIDVQPDFRYPFNYIAYNISSQYPDLSVKEFPFVSTFTLIAYQQILHAAVYLLHDIYERDYPSPAAILYKNDAYRKDYLELLLKLRVPKDLETLLSNLSTVCDPQKPRLV